MSVIPTPNPSKIRFSTRKLTNEILVSPTTSPNGLQLPY